MAEVPLTYFSEDSNTNPSGLLCELNPGELSVKFHNECRIGSRFISFLRHLWTGFLPCSVHQLPFSLMLHAAKQVS